MTSIDGAVCMATELFSLAGPEFVMMALGMLTYILFSGYNFLPTYWSCVDEIFPGRVPASPISGHSPAGGLKEKKQVEEKELVESKTTTTTTTATAEEEEEAEAEEEQQPQPSPEVVSPPLIQALAQGGLDANSVANVFLCLELSHIGAMGATCKAAKEGIWEDKELWLELGGPAFLSKKEKEKEEQPSDNLEVESPESVHLSPEVEFQAAPAKKLRDQFRVWLFGLDGSWSASFKEQAQTRHHADVFDEASYLLSGLTEQDSAEQIETFSACLTEQLALLDAGEEMANQAAVRLTEKAKLREELLGRSRVSEMLKAFEASTQYARVLGARMPL